MSWMSRRRQSLPFKQVFALASAEQPPRDHDFALGKGHGFEFAATNLEDDSAAGLRGLGVGRIGLLCRSWLLCGFRRRFARRRILTWHLPAVCSQSEVYLAVQSRFALHAFFPVERPGLHFGHVGFSGFSGGGADRSLIPIVV